MYGSRELLERGGVGHSISCGSSRLWSCLWDKVPSGLLQGVFRSLLVLVGFLLRMFNLCYLRPKRRTASDWRLLKTLGIRRSGLVLGLRTSGVLWGPVEIRISCAGFLTRFLPRHCVLSSPYLWLSSPMSKWHHLHSIRLLTWPTSQFLSVLKNRKRCYSICSRIKSYFNSFI